MIYTTLAKYYDALVEDKEATEAWLKFVNTYGVKGKVLELACGSGDLAIHMAKQGYDVHASDISEDMLNIAQTKVSHELVTWTKKDMRNAYGCERYDTILCFCDSLNYLIKEDEVRKTMEHAYAHLHENGIFLFDVHSLDRLLEFEEEYCESGIVNDMEYQWTIHSQDAFLYQVFAFYDSNHQCHVEQHIQFVYAPETLKEIAEQCGFQVEIWTDFDKIGCCEGEKHFFVCKKKEK